VIVAPKLLEVTPRCVEPDQRLPVPAVGGDSGDELAKLVPIEIVAGPRPMRSEKRHFHWWTRVGIMKRFTEPLH
jgi:hypothetical protein